MREYVSEGLVLGREPAGDFDARFSIYTRRYGKLVAKARSLRKITSKLAGHFEPGNFVFARFVEKNGLQLVDGLKTARSGIGFVGLARLDGILHERESDAELWSALCDPVLDWSRVLAVLGWDPRAARCMSCGSVSPVSFRFGTQEFFCARCAPRLSPVEAVQLV